MSNQQNKTRRTFASGQSPPQSVRARYELLPLDFLLQGVSNPRLHPRLRFEMAKAALPYVHERLEPIAAGADREPRHRLDLTKLTDAELAQLERIAAKSQVVVAERDGSEDE